MPLQQQSAGLAFFAGILLALSEVGPLPAALTAQSSHASGPRARASMPRPFTVVEATIPEMRDALARRRTTSVQIVTEYLARIATFEPRLHAVLAMNPA